jgi:hypothetical protein
LQLSLFLDRVLSAVTGGPVRSPAPASAPPPGTEGLIDRLKRLGLPRFARISTHRNAQVMLSFVPGQLLRVHEGYAHAPDEVLLAIVRFVTPGARRPVRLAAKRLFLDFPAEEHAPSRRTTDPLSRVAPADRPHVDRLRQLHESLNTRHFDGTLRPVPIRISGRMRQRLGELRMERKSGRPVHIGISRRHIRRDGWTSVAETLLHEMVHQWQAETGRPVDHGPEFRRKAREVGITPRAVKKV